MNAQTAADDVRQLEPGSDLHPPRRHRPGRDPRRRPVLRRPVPEARRGGLPDRPARTRGTATSSAKSSTWSTSGWSPTPAGSRWRRSRRRSAASSPAARRRPPRSTSSAARTGFDWAEANLPDRPPLPGRADRRHGRQDPDRGEQGRRPRRALRRRQRADLVSDHPVEQPGRVRRGVPQEAPRSTPDGKRTFAVDPGRGRAGRRRHGRRRGLGRGPRADRHRRARASR